jgi:hypothetical protein
LLVAFLDDGVAQVLTLLPESCHEELLQDEPDRASRELRLQEIGEGVHEHDGGAVVAEEVRVEEKEVLGPGSHQAKGHGVAVVTDQGALHRLRHGGPHH